jgi:hypothetical protein
VKKKKQKERRNKTMDCFEKGYDDSEGSFMLSMSPNDWLHTSEEMNRSVPKWTEKKNKPSLRSPFKPLLSRR